MLSDEEFDRLYGEKAIPGPKEPEWFAPGSTSESFRRGIISGMTLGAAPYAGALGHMLSGSTYAEGLAEERKAYRQAQQANPYTYGGAAIVGAGPAYAATGGTVAGAGALSGTESAIGASNEPGAGVGDIIASGAMGTVLGMGGQKVMNTIPNLPGKIREKVLGGSDAAYDDLYKAARIKVAPRTGNNLVTKAEQKTLGAGGADALAAERQAQIDAIVLDQQKHPFRGVGGLLLNTGVGSAAGGAVGAGTAFMADKDPISGAIVGAGGMGALTLHQGTPALAKTALKKIQANGVGDGGAGRYILGLFEGAAKRAGEGSGATLNYGASQLPNTSMVTGKMSDEEFDRLYGY